MGWQFQTVFVEVSGGTSASDQNHPFLGVASFGKPDQILEVRKAECALKSFHIRYIESDYNFSYQRIAIRDVLIAGPPFVLTSRQHSRMTATMRTPIWAKSRFLSLRM
jgi:hypothetical protein